MRATLIFIACVFMIGCAAAPVIEQQTIIEEPPIEEPVVEPTPEFSSVATKQDGVITKLSGAAYMRDVENKGYIILRQGDRIPIGRIFYLDPKTTMKIKQASGEEIFLYSKDHEAYYRLDPDTP
jgi:hypothetical protein